MSRHKYKNQILNDLWRAYDRIEGEYSGIPECCVEVYINGRTAHEFYISLDEKGKKKYDNTWQYVPCDKCFKENKKAKVKKNGTSFRGEILRTIMASIKKNGDYRNA
jgi:hypothetical protein